MNIIFSDKTIDVNEKRKIESLIENSLGKFDNLKLDDLEKIVLTANYFEEVEKAWLDIGKKDKGASNNEMAKGIGITISDKPLNKDAKSVVLISEDQWMNLLNENENEVRYCIHVINHELSHVHDITIKHGSIYSDEMKKGRLEDLTFRLRCEADEVWSEYIAERLSADTVTKEFIDEAKNRSYNYLSRLADLNARNNVLILRSWTRNNNYSEFMFYMDYALKSFAHLLGIIAGLGDNHKWSKDIELDVKRWLGQSSLIDVWKSMKSSLSELYDLYPNWSDIDQLDDLGKSILQSWKCFGYH